MERSQGALEKGRTGVLASVGAPIISLQPKQSLGMNIALFGRGLTLRGFRRSLQYMSSYFKCIQMTWPGSGPRSSSYERRATPRECHSAKASRIEVLLPEANPHRRQSAAIVQKRIRVCRWGLLLVNTYKLMQWPSHE